MTSDQVAKFSKPLQAEEISKFNKISKKITATIASYNLVVLC